MSTGRGRLGDSELAGGFGAVRTGKLRTHGAPWTRSLRTAGKANKIDGEDDRGESTESRKDARKRCLNSEQPRSAPGTVRSLRPSQRS